MKVKIGEFNQQWIVHPRKDGDLVLTSQAGVAIVDTKNKYAVVGTTVVSLEVQKLRELVHLRQDVVDRLLDAEEGTKASMFLPPYRIELSEEGVNIRRVPSDTTGLSPA